jgi:dCTP deaminase
MSVLTGPAILESVESEMICIDPFNMKQINPTSYDLRLGSKVRVYCEVGTEAQTIEVALGAARGFVVPQVTLDAAKSNHSVEFEIPTEGILLHPYNFYLMHTLERVATKCFQPSLEGKSSIARLGIEVHLTAGWGEPGFDGNYTLEVACKLPVRIYAGMLICQIKFETLEGTIIDYKKAGSYVGVDATGPVASRSFMQFAANAK